MKTSFSHSIACSLLVQPFSVKPQRQWGHSGEGGNQRSSGLSGAAPLWMTKGFIVSPEAEVDSSTEHQPVEPLASDRGGPVRRSNTTSSFWLWLSWEAILSIFHLSWGCILKRCTTSST